jgi:ABC-type transport system involved in cytochrome c biogenesis, permease component
MVSLLKMVIYSTLLFYTAAAISYFIGPNILKSRLEQAAFILLLTGGVLNLSALTIRTIMAGRLPLSSGWEFLLSFTFITIALYLIFELKSRSTLAGGPVASIAALLLLAVVILLGGQFGEVSPLMPALKSPWLAAHVLTAAAAYASFALAAGLAVMQLNQSSTGIQEGNIYRIVYAGFVLLSLSIVLGAVWAEQAWGSYWSWDPKEVWALVTWIIYAVYLHLYRSRDLRGNNASLLVIAGFVIVLFTFFGVNYFLAGLHSYAGVLKETAIRLS